MALIASSCISVSEEEEEEEEERRLWLSYESELRRGQREGPRSSRECAGLDVVPGSDSLRYFNGWRVECVAAGRSPRIRSSVTSSGPVCFTK